MNDILMRALENNRQTQIELLQKLIGFPTTKGNEEEAQKFMAAKMKELGAEIDLFEPDIEQLRKDPYFRSDRKDFKGSPVLSATLKGAGENLLFYPGIWMLSPQTQRTGAWTLSPEY